MTIESVRKFRVGEIHIGPGRTPLARIEMIEGRVDRDPVNPRTETGIAAETRQRTIHAHEHVLRDILTLGPVFDITADHTQHAVLIFTQQHIEGGAITGLRAGNQSNVFVSGSGLSYGIHFVISA